MRNLIFILFIFLSFSSSYGQNTKVSIGKARKYIRKGDYLKAAEVFENYLRLKPNDQIAEAQFAALLYFDLKNYEKANPHIKNALNNSTDTLSFGIPLLRTEIYIGNFIDAKSLCEKLIRFYSRKNFHTDELAIIKKIIDYNILNNKVSTIEKFEVGNLGDHINSPYADYVPITNEDEQFVWLTSKRKLNEKEKIQSIDNSFKEKMFSAKRISNGFDTVQLVHYEFKENKTFHKINNESFISVSQDGNQLFLYNEGTIWRCIKENGKWSKPSKFEEKIMDVKYTNHGSVSADGKLFYFSSEIDGKGGLDLFYTSKNQDGTWAQPVNIESLNTKGNEQGPFICPDGKTLYFSSDSLEGFGGYDIYRSTFDGVKWSTPQNIGLPFNSQADDIFFLPKENNLVGYFSSNRKGTLGNFDIYRFFSYEEHDFNNKNIVFINKSIDTSISFNAENIKEKINSLVSSQSKYPVFYKVNDSVVFNSFNQISELMKNTSINKIQIEEQLDCAGCAFKRVNFYNINPKKETEKSDVVISEQKTDVISETKNTIEKTKTDVANSKNSSELVSENISANKFFVKFNFNKNVPEPDEINNLIIFLKDKSNKIMIFGHTDSRGGEVYNYQLSLKRANNIKDILIKSGINKDRILSVKGFGESKPIVNCEPKCDAESNSKNRRVEIELIKE